MTLRTDKIPSQGSEVYKSNGSSNTVSKTPATPIFEGYSKTETNKSNSGVNNRETNQNSNVVLEYSKVLFSKGSSDKKIDIILDKYFSDDPKYINLSDSEKKDFRQQKLEAFMSLINPKNKVLSAKEKEKAGFKVVMLLALSKSENISFEQIQSMDTKKLQEIMMQTIGKYLNIMKEHIPDFDKKTPIEKSYAVVDYYLSLVDSDYNNLSDEQKRLKCKEFLNKRISKFMFPSVGDDKQNMLIDIDEIAKSISHFDCIDFMEYVAANVSDISKIKSSKEITRLLVEYMEVKVNGELKAKGEKLSKEEDDAIKFLKMRLDLIESCGKDNPTEKDLYNLLIEKQKSGKLSEQEALLLKEYKIRIEIDDSSMDDIAGLTSNIVLQKVFGVTDEELFKIQTSNIDFNTKEGKEQFEKIVQGYVKAWTIDCVSNEEIEKFETRVRAQLKNAGMSDEEIKAFIENNIYSQINDSAIAATAMVREQGKNAGQAVGRLSRSKDVVKQNQSKKLAGLAPREIKNKDEASNFGEEVIKTDNDGLVDSFNKGMHEYRTKEDNTYIHERIMSSQELNDSQRAKATSSFIRNAKSDEDKLYYNRHFVKLNNAGVTAGLATASKSISDKSIKQQYNANIENSMSNFTPEEQQAITYAMETGNLSNYTLSQTEPSPVNIQASYQTNIVKNEVSNIKNYTSAIPEKNTTKAYVSYFENVNKSLAQKRDAVADKLQQVKTNIEESQKSEEEKELEKLYKGISSDVVKQIKYAFETAGAAGVYAKLGDLRWAEAQKAFLIYFIQGASAEDLKVFASKYNDDAEVLQAICTYGNVNDLPSDLIVKCIEKGWVNVSNISDLRGILSENKNNLPFLRRIFDATKNISVLALNFDLLSEYINLGKINIALLPPSLYARYKNSLTPIRQQQLDEKLEQDRLSINFENNEVEKISYATEANMQNTNATMQAQTPIPGSPEFYAALNRQSEKYNPNNYFTGTVYDPRRIKKLNHKG